MYTLIQASPNHLDDLALLFDAYRIFYQKETDITAAKKFLSDRLTNNHSVVFMVYDGSRAAGFTQLYPLFSSVNMATKTESMDWIKRLSKQRKQDNITLIRKAVEDMVNSRLKRANRDKEVSL